MGDMADICGVGKGSICSRIKMDLKNGPPACDLRPRRVSETIRFAPQARREQVSPKASLLASSPNKPEALRTKYQHRDQRYLRADSEAVI